MAPPALGRSAYATMLARQASAVKRQFYTPRRLFVPEPERRWQIYTQNFIYQEKLYDFLPFSVFI